MQIIYENDNFIAVNKPAGVLVHPTTIQRKDEEYTLVDFILEKYPDIKDIGDNPDLRPGIVHRLDKDTSGVIVVCKTNEFFDYFKKLLQERTIKKTYLALVWGKIEGGGIINKKIGLKPGTTRQTTWIKDAKMVKDARTIYTPLETLKKDDKAFTFVELIPKTGRTHQLRVHMASIHHSIVGDTRYGKSGNPWKIKRQLLHARSLEFNLLDSNKRVKLEADLPKDFVEILKDCNSQVLKQFMG